MNRMLQIAIFMSIFLGIYFGMHVYIFLRMTALFAIKRRFYMYLILVAIALAMPLVMALERTAPNTLFRGFYTFAMTWLGMLWLLFATLVVYEIVKIFVKLSPRTFGFIILGIVLALTLYGIINALFVRVKTIEIPMPHLAEEKTIVQLSDIHVGTVHNSEYVQMLVKKTNAQRPDLVLITGDMVDGNGGLSAHSYEPLKQLKAPTYFTTGNHERYVGAETVSSLLNKTGIHVLRDEVVTAEGIQIIGIDDSEDFGKTNKALADLTFDRNKPSIVMYHQPAGVKDAAERGVNLQLSGHTHDGQVWPFNYLVRLSTRYVYGLYKYNGTYIYVSPGSGTWGPPMRIGSHSEITRIRLIPA
jgi:uncharacterized protein